MTPLEVLAKPDAGLAQVLQALAALDATPAARTRRVGVSGAVTLDLLGTALRREAWRHGTRVDVVMGNYDDPVGDAARFVAAGVEEAVFWPFFDNLRPGFEAQVPTLDAAMVDAIEGELRARWRLALAAAAPLARVYLGAFHRLGAAATFADPDVVDVVLARFDAALREEAAKFPNVKVIDARPVVAAVGANASFDLRFYFRGKAPYTFAFCTELARRIVRVARGFGAWFYKAVVLDCDNTLWGGIVGEDLLTGIKLGPHDAPGSIFWRVQHELVALEQAGILLCLCSKNNAADVDEVLDKHPEMVIRDRHLVLKQVNWDDKPTNLRKIAATLNIGLDSLIFLDDSAFEVEAVRSQLPAVRVFQVPTPLSDYPKVLAEIRELCLAGGVSAESRGKTAQYRQRADAEQARAEHGSHEDYLASLGLKVELTRDATGSVPRIAELTQKSNQFNLTTRRYTEAEILARMGSPDHAVYSLVVSDKFGVAGLTGVATIAYEGDTAVVENFLMSCRVIGRGVETGIWRKIVADAAARGCTRMTATFVPSAKNALVVDFLDRLGFPRVEVTEAGVQRYEIATATWRGPETPWIETTYVE